jgi:hypothetical protein
VAWYRFDEGAIGSVPSGSVPDYSGNGLNGVPYGTNGPRYVTGLDLVYGKALDFDGTDDRIYVPDDPKLQLTHSLTLEACLNLHSFKPASNGNSFIVWRGDTRGGMDPYNLVLDPTAQELRFWIEGTTPGDFEDLRTPFTWLNQPVHVAGVLNDATGFMGLYVNGQLKASTTTGTRPFGALDPSKKPGLGIGGFWTPTGTAFYLDGVIDEVRISDVPLDASQFLCSAPPSLVWTGEFGYTSDGLNPDSGNPTGTASPTTFTFRVRCKQPYFPATTTQCLIQHCVGGVWQSYKGLTMTPVGGDVTSGRIYAASTQLPNEVFRYAFFFANSRGVSTGEPAQYRPGPLMVGPPQLRWSSATGFGEDGVKPDSGEPGTRFRFEVVYSDSAGDPPTLRRLLIRRNGTQYRGITLNPVTGGDYREGMTFFCYTKLTEAGTYTYRFKFRDASGLATGPPAAWKSGPAVAWPPEPPVLEWVGAPGYESDGVDPDMGDANSTTFIAKVKYTDRTGAAPLRARCLIQRRSCGDGWAACRSLALTKESGDISTGAIYAASVTLPNLVYKYRFSFRDGTGTDVSGEPASFGQGPLIVGKPWVCWTGASGFGSDGVSPDSGAPGTSFRFQVKYADSVGDEPTTCKLLVRRYGRLLLQEPLSAASSGDLRLGKVYRTSVRLDTPGSYEYRFSLADASGNALGPPSNWTDGPTITGSGSAMVTSLAAAPTRAGAQITFSLSGAANVTATVLNVAGRPIRTIAADKPLDAGLQTLLWDRRAETGLPVPSGLYLIRVKARDARGGQSTTLATVALR